MANSGNDKPGNFSTDRDKASEAGKKGGQASGGHQQSRDSDRMSGGGQGTNRGGEFADDKQDMSKPGQKGGQASGGQQSRKPDQSTSGGRDSNVADDDSADMGRKDGGMSGGGGHKP